jgi:hypothetical protein
MTILPVRAASCLALAAIGGYISSARTASAADKASFSVR